MKKIYSNKENKILYICKNKYKYFLDKPNVIGVGLGYKIKNGFNTFRKCISVFVTRKVLENKLYTSAIIPKVYNKIETDVVECGTMETYELKARIRPVVGGYSISPSMGNGDGTSGCLVQDSENLYFLGSNHVFTFNESLNLGVPMVQPSIVDGGIVSRDTVGNLYKYIPLVYDTKSKVGINFCDCAIGKVISKSVASPSIEFIGRLNGINIPILNQHVQKTARTTEYTVGSVIGIGVTMRLDYKKGSATFINQILTTKMGDIGDSGGILCNFNKEALGMLVSGSPTTTLFNPITTVLNSLNVTIVR